MEKGGRVMVIGIDPGKTGALACIWDSGESGIHVTVMPMPLVTSSRGRDEYNESAIRDLLLDRVPMTVFIEKLDPMPAFLIGRKGPGDTAAPRAAAGGSIANYQRGAAVYLFRGMLTALRIPFEFVHPRTWQREMHQGSGGSDTKQRSILVAQRLFPGLSLLRTPRSRKADDGVADALLIAEYGRRRLHGGLAHGVAAEHTVR